MTYNPFGLYLVAWDWLLVGLYGVIGLFALVAIVACLLVEFADRSAIKPVKPRTSRMTRFLDGLSQAGNVLLYNGEPNHSISGDAWRYRRDRMMALANWLFRYELHCKHAHLRDVWQADRLLAQTPLPLIAEARRVFDQETGR